MDRTILTLAVLIAKLPVPAVPEAAEEHSNSIVHMPEDRLCRMLAAFGAARGIRVVMIDAAGSRWLSSSKLTGYGLNGNVWTPCTFEPPAIVYDRTFAESADARFRCRSAMRLLGEAGALPLGGELPGKWTVHRALTRDPLLHRLLPPTRPYKRAELMGLLKKQPEGLFLKPAAGSQGRGAIRIWRDVSNGVIIVKGRTRTNRPFSFQSSNENTIIQQIDRFIGARTYLIQPFLPLTDAEGRSHDIRLLVQKTSRGQWSVTGAVCRIGAEGSITSNLHGGGSAENAEVRLTRLFGSSQANELLERIKQAGLQAASVIEQHYGKFAEFGFDFGLSQDGKLWLLEANSKPGRQSFKLTGDLRTEQLSVIRLLTYAKKLASSRRLNPQADKRSNHYDDGFPSDYVQEVHP